MHTLEVSHIVKHYKSRAVVNDLSLKINSGEIVGLLGPNGAGKTTSFYIIVGLVAPDKGRLLFNKRNITNLTINKRSELGISYLPQEPSIFRKLTVTDNIMAILELNQELSKAEREDRLEKLLHEFRINHIKNNLGLSLSGGERRRVEIARALATQPKFILLDEPFAGIDPISVIDLKRVIKQLRALGIGVLITDHNVRETLDICERAYIVNKGKIICTGTSAEVLKNKEVRDVYIGDYFELAKND